jgi:hypothetical protein
MGRFRVFMSFDLGHDRDLMERLVEESAKAGASFEILGCSEAGAMTSTWNDRVRRRIGAADEVIVICGEHTEESTQVGAELGIAREEHKPTSSSETTAHVPNPPAPGPTTAYAAGRRASSATRSPDARVALSRDGQRYRPTGQAARRLTGDRELGAEHLEPRAGHGRSGIVTVLPSPAVQVYVVLLAGLNAVGVVAARALEPGEREEGDRPVRGHGTSLR